MKENSKTFARTLVMIALTLCVPPLATADSYTSLDGLEGLEIVFDFRLDHPEKAALFLELIHGTYKDDAVHGLGNPPIFVIVFNGAAVKLIAEGREVVSEKDEAHLREIANTIALLAADGVRMEGCLVAAGIFKVDPDLFLSEIEPLDNAWISIAGYQTRRFSAIPVV